MQVGNAFAASGKQYANFIYRKWWDSAPLKERLYGSHQMLLKDHIFRIDGWRWVLHPET